MKLIDRYRSELNIAEENFRIAKAIEANYRQISQGETTVLDIDFGEPRGLVSVPITHWLTQQGIPFRIFIDSIHLSSGD